MKCYKVFLLYVQVEVYQNILKLRCRPLAFTFLKLFWKTKRGPRQVFLPHFQHDFWRKIFSLYIVLTDQISMSDCLYFLRYRVICVLIVIICCPVCEVINFEINHNLFIAPFSYITKMSGQNYKYLKKLKKLTWN